MQENITDSNFQDTIPEENLVEEKDIMVESQEIATPSDDDALDQDIARDTEMPTAQSSVSEKAAVTEPFITVQYNHQNRSFTKDEAVQFIQKGMHTEALRTKLEYLAKLQNTDVNSIVENLVTAPEMAYKNHLENIYGKDSEDVEIGMKIYREKQSQEYKDIVAADEKTKVFEENKNNINSRLADEYLYLKQQIPDAPQYSELPDDVIVEAANGKRDLFSAYLCYLHKEKVKISAAQKAQEAAQTASAGKMNSIGDNTSLLEQGFLSGLWSK